MPVDPDGSVRVSGACRYAQGARPPPTTLRLTMCRGPMERAIIEVPIPLPPAAESDDGDATLGRLFEVQHTLLTLNTLKLTHWDPSEVKAKATKVACAAGLASEYSSLLLAHG